MHLRRRRAVYARRRSARGRLVLTGGVLALIIGVASWAPLGSRASAPSEVGQQPAFAALASGTKTALSDARSPATQTATARTATPTRMPVPQVGSTPVVVPTPSPSGRALLAAVVSDRTSPWVKNHTETRLLSGPSDNAVVFTQLPQWSLLKQIESRPNWLLVEYSGDGATRQAGPGWVKAGDVGRVDPPTVWLRSARTGSVWSAADGGGKRLVDVPASILMEVIGPDYVSGGRLHVRLPGDGRSVPPTQGWVDGDVLARTGAPAASDLPWAYPEDLRADVRINVPYRTQLDGSDYAGANCGPTVLGMVLESFGLNLAPPELRSEVLSTEQFQQDDTDAGSYIWALAQVAQAQGLRARGLYESDGPNLHRWSLNEIRDSVRRNRPVIVQVVYRGLPERADSGYYGDHYIIITGLLGDSFLYNDPIGGAAAHESPGYDRLISPSQLQQAMRASDSAYEYTAFDLSRS